MEPVTKHTRLMRRGAVYYFRAKIPVDLLGVYAPKKEITLSLGTRDRREADILVCKESVRINEQFARDRAFRDSKPQTTISGTEVARLADIYLHERLAEDEEVRQDGTGDDKLYAQVAAHLEAKGVAFERGFTEAQNARASGMTDREWIKMTETLDWVEGPYREALARGDIRIVEDDVEDLLEVNGIKLEKGSPAFRQVAFAILKAEVKANDLMRQRNQGDPIDTPPGAASATAPLGLNGSPSTLSAQAAPLARLTSLSSDPSADVTLSAVWGIYAEERRLPAKTVSDFGTYVRRFIEVNGDPLIGAVTKAHVRAYKDAMLRLPVRVPKEHRGLTVPEVLQRYPSTNPIPRLQVGTVNEKALGAISAVLGYAVANGYRDTNPATGIKATGPKSYEPPRVPYSAEDLRVIFSSPVFLDGYRPIAAGGEASKWLPLLALFTGARLEELGRLDVADIRDEDGIAFLAIHTMGEGRSVKTRSARRKVPIHPELIRLGFLQYVEERV